MALAHQATTPFEVVGLSGSIGAEIRGIDLRQDLPADTIAAIRAVWLERKVVFFPDQDLDPAQHLAFASRFGQVTEGHPVIPGMADQPEVFEIDYTAARRRYQGRSFRSQGVHWHTDVTFMPRPPQGSILRAVVIPPTGGDTLFSDQAAAYDALSPALAEFLCTLTARHDGRGQFQAVLDHVGQGRWDGAPIESLDPVEHPVVRTHPETGRRSLFVNPGFTTGIVQLDPAESQALLSFLYAHSVRPEFTVRHHWHAGDLAFWDNRTTQHAVVGDFGDQHRVIQRITLRGDEPRLD